MTKSKLLVFLSIMWTISSCTRIPEGNQEQVIQMIQDRTGYDVQWDRSMYDPSVSCYIDKLLSQPISIESAVQIALLNNPDVQATFEEVGIAQADLVEAGLLSNPAFEIEVRYPNQKGLKTNIEYLITSAFLDVFLIPLRTKLASIELEQAKLKVANAILDLTFEVRQTYYELIAEQQKITSTEAIAELASIQNEISYRQLNVGNIYKLELEEMQALFFEADMQILHSQEKIIHLKEEMNRLLGLNTNFCLLFLEQLPEELEFIDYDLCLLERIVLHEKIELQVARYEVMRFAQLLGLKEWWTYSNVRLGIAGEREIEGQNTIGPGFSGEIPIFNYGQAERMRIYAKLRQAQEHLNALEVRALSEVREAHKVLMQNAHMIKKYKNEILPIRHNILQTSEQLYNVMGLGIDRLLRYKRNELESQHNYITTLKDYWLARVQLDKALGGNLFLILPLHLSCSEVAP